MNITHSTWSSEVLPLKDNDLQAVFDYLQNNVATATMTAIALNIAI